MENIEEILNDSKISRRFLIWLVISQFGLLASLAGYVIYDKFSNKYATKSDIQVVSDKLDNYKISNGIKLNELTLDTYSLSNSIQNVKDYVDNRLASQSELDNKRLIFVVKNAMDSKKAEMVQSFLEITKQNVIDIIKQNVVVKSLPKGLDELVAKTKPKGYDTVIITRTLIVKDTIKETKKDGFLKRIFKRKKVKL